MIEDTGLQSDAGFSRHHALPPSPRMDCQIEFVGGAQYTSNWEFSSTTRLDSLPIAISPTHCRPIPVHLRGPSLVESQARKDTHDSVIRLITESRLRTGGVEHDAGDLSVHSAIFALVKMQIQNPDLSLAWLKTLQQHTVGAQSESSNAAFDESLNPQRNNRTKTPIMCSLETPMNAAPERNLRSGIPIANEEEPDSSELVDVKGVLHLRDTPSPEGLNMAPTSSASPTFPCKNGGSKLLTGPCNCKFRFFTKPTCPTTISSPSNPIPPVIVNDDHDHEKHVESYFLGGDGDLSLEASISADPKSWPWDGSHCPQIQAIRKHADLNETAEPTEYDTNSTLPRIRTDHERVSGAAGRFVDGQRPFANRRAPTLPVEIQIVNVRADERNYDNLPENSEIFYFTPEPGDILITTRCRSPCGHNVNPGGHITLYVDEYFFSLESERAQTYDFRDGDLIVRYGKFDNGWHWLPQANVESFRYSKNPRQRWMLMARVPLTAANLARPVPTYDPYSLVVNAVIPLTFFPRPRAGDLVVRWEHGFSNYSLHWWAEDFNLAHQDMVLRAGYERVTDSTFVTAELYFLELEPIPNDPRGELEKVWTFRGRDSELYGGTLTYDGLPLHIFPQSVPYPGFVPPSDLEFEPEGHTNAAAVAQGFFYG